MATPAKAYVRHQLPRMVEGLFVGPGQVVRGAPLRFPSAVLPRLSADPTRDSEFTCLDLVQVATVNPPDDWAWAVLSDVGRYGWGHTIGLDLKEPWQFVSWAYGAPRTYSVAYGPLITRDDIATAYGTDAAGCARPDYKSIQLVLTHVP